MFIRSVVGYFIMLGGMHLLIQSALKMSSNVYTGAAIAAFIILLVSFYLAVADKRFR